MSWSPNNVVTRNLYQLSDLQYKNNEHDVAFAWSSVSCCSTCGFFDQTSCSSHPKHSRDHTYSMSSQNVWNQIGTLRLKVGLIEPCLWFQVAGSDQLWQPMCQSGSIRFERTCPKCDPNHVWGDCWCTFGTKVVKFLLFFFDQTYHDDEYHDDHQLVCDCCCCCCCFCFVPDWPSNKK